MKKKCYENYPFIFWTFILGSFIGFLCENIYTVIFKDHYAFRQGLIYEPLIPIYGIGVLIFYFIYKRVKISKDKKLIKKILNILIIYLIGLVCGSSIEYACSFLQEKIFGTVSWDYSYLKYHLNGRVSLYHSTFWGIAGVVFYLFLLPILEKIKTRIVKDKYKNITILFSLILLFDCSISSLACYRQDKRRNNELAQNYLDVFLDKHYPDEYLKKIFNNARVPKSKK